MLRDSEGNEYFLFDCHTHMGSRPNVTLGHASFDAEQMIADMDACGVDMVVGFPMANPHTDYREQNRRLMAFMNSHPDRIVALARIQPGLEQRGGKVMREYSCR